MILFDTHAHLSMLEHESTETILDLSQRASVGYLTTVSTEEDNWEKNRHFAQQYGHIYYSLGLHPHEAKDWPELKPKLESYFTNNLPPEKCVGIGETGLDFHYNHSPREAQLTAFEDQLLLSIKTKLPLIIHCRDAFEDTYALIRKHGLSTLGGVMHCFTGNADQARAAVELGLKISFSGIFTFKNAEAIREAARQIPLESIVIETDCPFLTPEPHRGKPNDPSFLPHTAKKLAEVLGLSIERIAEITTQNAMQLFGIQA